MLWRNVIVLSVIAVTFAVGNLWFAAQRSLMPLHLDDVVQSLERRTEKHPGRDDVWLVTFQSGTVLHVDAEVAALLSQGQRITKESWSYAAVIGGKPVVLRPSDDLRGMLRAMPLLLILLAATCFAASRVRPVGESPVALNA